MLQEANLAYFTLSSLRQVPGVAGRPEAPPQVRLSPHLWNPVMFSSCCGSLSGVPDLESDPLLHPETIRPSGTWSSLKSQLMTGACTLRIRPHVRLIDLAASVSLGAGAQK